MKIAEKWFEQDGKLVVQKTHDWNPLLDKASSLRSAEVGQSGDHRLVGLVDMDMWAMWAKEAGISFTDPDASQKMKEVVKRKMLDGDFAKLRVWGGTY